MRETDAEPGNWGGGSGGAQAGADQNGIRIAELFYEQSEDGSVQRTVAGPGVGDGFHRGCAHGGHAYPAAAGKDWRGYIKTRIGMGYVMEDVDG